MLKKKQFLKYIFYQNALKKGKKHYFLLDFFRGIKGAYPLKKRKFLKKLKFNFLYKSFSLFKALDLNLKKNYYFDYFFKDLNVYFFKNFKIFKKIKKNNIFLATFLEYKDFFLFSLKHIWLIKLFLNLKSSYLSSLSFNLFNPFYLNNYYFFIKQNLIINSKVFIKEFFKYKCNIKCFNFKHYLLKFFNFFIIFNKNFYKNRFMFYYNKYNKFKNIKILFINKIFRKFNKFIDYLKFFDYDFDDLGNNSIKFKLFFINFFKFASYNNLNINSTLNLNLVNKKIKFKYANTFFLENNKKKDIKGTSLILKFSFFINFLYKLYSNQCLNNFNKHNILLTYYFYFYNFIIKNFIKLLYNFKFVMLNQQFSKNFKVLIWIKIYLIFLYYKKIFLNSFKSSKKNKIKFINLILLKDEKISQDLINKNFDSFKKIMPLGQSQFLNGKLNSFLEGLQAKLSLIKKIKYYKIKRFSSLIRFKIDKLEQILDKLEKKLNKMKAFKETGVLKACKLKKLIKANNLKFNNVSKFVGF